MGSSLYGLYLLLKRTVVFLLRMDYDNRKKNVGPGSVGFSDYLDKLHANKTIIFQRNLSILESMPQNFANYFIYIRNHRTLDFFFKIIRGEEINLRRTLVLTNTWNRNKYRYCRLCYKANIIDPEGTNGKRIGVMFTFDRNTDIGKIQLGDEFFACVSANALNPPSGTACEKRHVKSFDEPNVLAAGHIR